MPRLFLLAMLGLYVGDMAAQDSSLTRDFARLSAKERSRIAKVEVEEAAVDAAFQGVMASGMEFFRQQRYEDALERYTEARRLRPYNVYPPVKIQDLQALIAKREAEQAALVLEGSEKPEEVPAPGTVVPERPATMAQPPAPQPAMEPPAAADDVALPATPAEQRPSLAPVPTTAPVTRPGPAPAPRPVVPAPEQAPWRDVPAAVLTDGVHERIYREGRAVVVERQVVAAGRSVLYRRVSHPHGDVVHFRDGVAIPERAWNEVFGD